MKWISVDEKLPEDRVAVLVWNKDSVEIGFMSKGKWQSWAEFYRSVTHWMPLPEAPSEVKMKTALPREQDNDYYICVYTGHKPKSANEQPEGKLLRKYRCSGINASVIDKTRVNK